MKSYELLLPLLAIAPALALPEYKPLQRRADPDPSLSTSFNIGGETFINKGLVAFGLIPSDAKDQYGETLGGFGSAITLKRGTFQCHEDGTFSGKFVVQPDRGYNVIAPIDWQTRQHLISFTLKPYYGAGNLSFADAKNTLLLDYISTTLYSWQGAPTSGANPTFIKTLHGDPTQYPVVAANETHLVTDPEGLVQNKDGTFWMSDEYGPYVHLISANGKIITTVTPPPAAIPRINGTVNFDSLVTPDTGRSPNQGLEGLTASPSGNKLYALMQSALMQEGGGNKTINQYARFFKWDVSNLNHIKLDAEYVVPLPQSSKPQTYAQSEIHWLNKHQFLVLARDGNGNGDNTAKATYKAADVFDISSATNIANTDYDKPTGSIAPGGQLVSGITPATYYPFVQYINDTQLARFGLHNGKPVDQTLINSKWESLALAPVGDNRYPNDYFLFTFSDNDFITENGVSLGQPYNATQNVDNQALVYRVTLPTVEPGKVEKAIGI